MAVTDSRAGLNYLIGSHGRRIFPGRPQPCDVTFSGFPAVAHASQVGLRFSDSKHVSLVSLNPF